MSAHSKGSHRQRAIEFLAQEWQVPVHQVTELYESEWAELAVDARISGFLPIFAFRNVRETLRQRALRGRHRVAGATGRSQAKTR